jgi:hypothetical protein
MSQARNIARGTGTTANSLVQLNGSAQLPAVSGALLTNLPAGATGFANMQVFSTAGTSNFTVPAGITKVKVTVVGGGGGVPNSGSGGGGGGGAAIKIISGLTPGGTVAVTVGAGGTGNVGSTSIAGTGGTSSFGAYCSATGGSGAYGRDTSQGPLPGAGGVGSSGDLNSKGGSGFTYWSEPLGSGDVGGGNGGSSLMCGNPRGAINASTPLTAENGMYGSGAGGSISVAPFTVGLAGAAGVVVVEY